MCLLLVQRSQISSSVTIQYIEIGKMMLLILLIMCFSNLVENLEIQTNIQKMLKRDIKLLTLTYIHTNPWCYHWQLQCIYLLKLLVLHFCILPAWISMFLQAWLCLAWFGPTHLHSPLEEIRIKYLGSPTRQVGGTLDIFFEISVVRLIQLYIHLGKIWLYLFPWSHHESTHSITVLPIIIYV